MSTLSAEDLLHRLREHALARGWTVPEEKPIQSGRQLTVSDGAVRCRVNVFSTGKVVVQGAESPLRLALEQWRREMLEGPQGAGTDPAAVPAASAAPAEAGNRTARFAVAEGARAQVKTVLAALTDEVRDAAASHELFRATVRRGDARAVATQYATGTLLVQGRAGELFEDVCRAIEGVVSQSFAERGARFVPESERAAVLAELGGDQAEPRALAWARQHLGDAAYGFLAANDQATYLSGVGLLLAAKDAGLALPDGSVVTMPFARAFEGFVIQLAVRLGLARPDAIKEDAAGMKAGAYLEQVKDRLLAADRVRYGGLADTLMSAWRDVRNKVLHSDPENPPLHTTLTDAEQDIATLNRAMKRGLGYLVERRIVPPAPSSPPDPPVPSTTGPGDSGDTAGDLTAAPGTGPGTRGDSAVHLRDAAMIVPRSPTERPAPPFSKSCPAAPAAPRAGGMTALPDVGEPRVGIDESGKGDYYGPLVVSGVYVDGRTAPLLRELGVRDSKRLSDPRIAALARDIKALCPHEVVVILPPRYNTLYTEIGNLNKVLAWGHARSLENLLERVPCELAVADQFGDESFLRNALMKRGKRIRLVQRPRAEADVAVAAASILARAEFVARLAQLSTRTGRTLPKGSSDHAIVEIGRTIAAQGGRPALAEVAKLHFQTTGRILVT